MLILNYLLFHLHVTDLLVAFGQLIKHTFFAHLLIHFRQTEQAAYVNKSNCFLSCHTITDTCYIWYYAIAMYFEISIVSI